MLTNDINNMRNLNACKYFEKILASFLLIVAFVISGCYFKEKKNKTGGFENTTTGNRNDTWKTVGFGGGGATFYPEISPFNSEYAFVSCDMTGSYVTYNGGGSWKMFNLHSPVDFYV